MNISIKQAYLSALNIPIWLEKSLSAEIEAPVNLIESSHSVTIEGQLSQLSEQVRQCTACHLCQSRTQTVFGVGTAQADLMVIGEAPGYYEDQQGEPFVGRAGQLLNAMLSSIGLDRTSIYIANILKCRPPNNRDPQASEVVACTGYLQQQIDLIQPKVLCAVGRIAGHFLLNTELSLAKLRNQTHYYGTKQLPLIITYHPAYLLRNPSAKAKAYVDLQRLRQQL